MSESENAGSLVPQVFYDILSRIAPGTIVFPMLIAAWVGPEAFYSSMLSWAGRNSSSILLILLWVVVAYYTGTFLRGLNYLLVHERPFAIWKRKRQVLSPPAFDYGKYYRIKVDLPDAGSRVTKMKAERSEAAVLATGCLFSLLVNLAISIRNPTSPRLLLGIFLLVATLSADALRRHLAKRLTVSVETHYKLILDRETGFHSPKGQ